MRLWCIVHKPSGDVAMIFDGMTQAVVQQMIQNQGFTVDFITQAAYNAYLIANPPPTFTPAQILAQERAAAVNVLLTDPSPLAKLIRAAVFGLLDENNLLRQRDNDRAADVAAASTFADLKTRWAARPTFLDRTATQAKTFVQNKVIGGAAD
jgi:hypothetical protein